MRGIVILEGADGTGKTTLARTLQHLTGARYLRPTGPRRTQLAYDLARLSLATRLAQDQLVVVDRWWLSEQVYGRVFRGGPQYDDEARALDAYLQRAGAVTVLCVRHDVARHLAHFDRLKAERPERFSDIAVVAKLFRDVVTGDERRLGSAYLDDLIRGACRYDTSFAQRPDVLLYDMDVWNGEASRLNFINMLLHMVDKRGHDDDI